MYDANELDVNYDIYFSILTPKNLGMLWIYKT